MPQARTLIIFSLIIASLMALWGWSEVGRYSDLYTKAETSRVAAEARAERIQRAVATVDKRNAELRHTLNESLRLNREWADGRTPPAVYDSLCARANCARVQPVPTPAD